MTRMTGACGTSAPAAYPRSAKAPHGQCTSECGGSCATHATWSASTAHTNKDASALLIVRKVERQGAQVRNTLGKQRARARAIAASRPQVAANAHVVGAATFAALAAVVSCCAPVPFKDLAGGDGARRGLNEVAADVATRERCGDALTRRLRKGDAPWT